MCQNNRTVLIKYILIFMIYIISTIENIFESNFLINLFGYINVTHIFDKYN